MVIPMLEKLPSHDVDSRPVVLWFHSDLRLNDHPGVNMALSLNRPIIPVYVQDQQMATRPLGACSIWWLRLSLQALSEDIAAIGSRLILLAGDAAEVIADFCEINAVKTVISSHTFDPKCEKIVEHAKSRLKQQGVELNQHNATLLTAPGHVRTQDGRQYRVFTPFFNAMQVGGHFVPPRLLSPEPRAWPAPSRWPDSLTLDTLPLPRSLTSSGVDWAAGFNRFTPGEKGAREALKRFLRLHLRDYADGRDRPDLDLTSHLSPHLRFGEISPQRVLHEVDAAVLSDPSLTAGAKKFRAELAWREFSYGLLQQMPNLHTENFKADFDNFPWRDDDKGFRAWCRGETGYPLVDAGMRELWQTGYMHNRVRMVCASFLSKHLLIDWRRGEQWFWDCLLDADPANNPASWQWVAGCGADAAPYFRIFNPISQAEKFDPSGAYRRRYLGANWTPAAKARQDDLFAKPRTAGYPPPIVDHAQARQRALDAYQQRSSS